jgi:hypothetical protein
MDYLSHPENIPKNHPGFVLDVNIQKTEGDTITYEQHIEMMKRKMRQLQKMTIWRDQKKITIDTIDGDGKGSKITMTVSDASNAGS